VMFLFHQEDIKQLTLKGEKNLIFDPACCKIPSLAVNQLNEQIENNQSQQLLCFVDFN